MSFKTKEPPARGNEFGRADDPVQDQENSSNGVSKVNSKGGHKPLSFTRITSTNPPLLTKSYKLRADGTLEKIPGGQMVEGSAEVIHLAGLEDFIEVLTQLDTNQALAFGLPPVERCEITSERLWHEQGKSEGVYTRSRKHFRFVDDPGIMFLDFDPKPNTPALGREELCEKLESVAPGILDAGGIWWPSSSSHICNGDDDLTGLRGQRIYVPVARASDIPRAGELLSARLWLAGYGHVQISASGALLPRTLFDASVWQSERFDFSAGAHCHPPLEQRRGEPVLIEGDGRTKHVDTKSILPDLSRSDSKKVKKLVAEAKAKAEPEAQKVKDAWLTARIDSEVRKDKSDIPHHEKREVARTRLLAAAERRELGPDFMITVIVDGAEEPVRVSEILANPERYDRLRTLDPLEPELYNRQDCGVLYLEAGDEHLYSYAHGGASYKLHKQKLTLVCSAGNTHEITDKAVKWLQRHGDLYDRGGALVRISDGVGQVLDKHSLGHNLAHQLNWLKEVKDGTVPTDPPLKVCEQILSMSMLRGLRELKQIVTAPLILPSGRVISSEGFDEETGLFFDLCSEFNLLEKPDEAEVKKALERLWVPFQEFRFRGPVDSGVFLAAILTAVTRPGLDLAPIFGIDAAEQGSGKTLLGRCIAAIATGFQAVITPHVVRGGEEEIRKRIYALLLQCAGVVVWDNVIGMFDSPAFAALVTSPRYSDRKLGVSETTEVAARTMWIVTGNNLTPAGDMPRRIAMCRIEPNVTDLYSREFDLDPEKYCLENRTQMVTDAITIIQGYMAHSTGAAPGRVPTFEQWDALVRQPVAWIAQTDARFADPIEAFRTASRIDPQREQDGTLFRALYGVFGEGEFKAEDVQNLVRKTCARADYYSAPPRVTDEEQQLAQAVYEFMHGRKLDSLTTRDVGGSILRYRNGRTAQGLRLKQERTLSNVVFWRVLVVDPVAFNGGQNLVDEAEALIQQESSGSTYAGAELGQRRSA